MIQRANSSCSSKHRTPAVAVLIALVAGILCLLAATGGHTQASGVSAVHPLAVTQPGPNLQDCESGAADPGCAATQPPANAAGHPTVVSSTHSLWLPVTASGPGPDAAPFGVQLYRSNAALVDHVTETGAGWIRIPLDWSTVEPENTKPKNFQWSEELDEQLATLSRKNVRIILTLEDNPAWAATYPGGPVDLADISQLVQFMRAAVARYGAPPYNVKHWEFYNEPDNGNELLASSGWGYFGYQPEAYVEMLSAVYGSIKAVDPQAQIVFGGLAYDRWTSVGGPFVEEFLDKVLEGEGAKYFDLMNFHYYPGFRDVWQPYGQGIIGKATYLRRKMAAYDVYKPVICTETGMWSDAANGGSDELQSRYVGQAFARAMVADLQPTIWFQLLDDSRLGVWKFGLLDPDLRPKPSYQAYQTAVEQLSPAECVRTLEAGETGSAQIEAYEFLVDGGLTTLVMAWANDEQVYPLVLEVAQVTVVDKYGSETFLSDGDDGAVDGKVQATIGPSPIYLRFQP